jgi:hypothetical protein
MEVFPGGRMGTHVKRIRPNITAYQGKIVIQLFDEKRGPVSSLEACAMRRVVKAIQAELKKKLIE